MSNNTNIIRAKQFMLELGLDILLIPSEDPHLSEYPHGHWKIREKVSGFTGSNGFLVLSNRKDGLWTDSRYFLQAEDQLKGSGIQLFKEGTDDPSWMEWIGSTFPQGIKIGLNGTLFSQSTMEHISSWATEMNFILKTDINNIPIETESLPDSPVFIHEQTFCGKNFNQKKEDIFKHCKGDFLLLCALDEIAWAFNLRGADIDYNPVAIAYAIVGKEESFIFIDNHKLSKEVKSSFKEQNIIVLPYDHIFEMVEAIIQKGKISVDPQKVNHCLFNRIPQEYRVVESSPITLLKSIKNNVEIGNIRNAMTKDGVALVKAFYKIEGRINTGIPTSELDVASILKEERSKQDKFFCESFSTIAGYADHGAIVHYCATEESNAIIGKESLLLVDSGANFLDGTTDITRVFCYGNPTKQQKEDYTNVLKGHIAIATCKFPKGTEGAHIDALAHQFLWKKAVDYGHGTGHGIGFFLCVHEGPQRINRRFSGVELQPNMIISDEPGLYRTNQYGIRIENVVRVKESCENEFGTFFEFETMTLFPYEAKLIDNTILTSEEKCWINTYHKKVREVLSPYLNEEETKWLKNVTKDIS